AVPAMPTVGSATSRRNRSVASPAASSTTAGWSSTPPTIRTLPMPSAHRTGPVADDGGMRRIITGAGPDGTSRVESIEDLPDSYLLTLATFTGVPEGLASPRGSADILDLGVAPGESRWVLARYVPDWESAFHRTHTIDFDTVL